MTRPIGDSACRSPSWCADAIMIICADISSGFVVREGVIDRRVRENIPFIASEEILMKAAARGGDRQVLHEVIRGHAITAADRMKNEGVDNDLIDRLAADPAFDLDADDLEELLEPGRFIGRAPSQVRDFIEQEVDPLLARHEDEEEAAEELRV